jgi:hypothetical protein
MTWNHEPENPLSPSEENAPFFATKDAFLHAVYDNWTYFVRYLLKYYSMLCGRERETGSRAPVNVGWWVSIAVPRANRRFDALLKSCDVQDLLVDALELCTKNPRLRSFYRQYTPRYHERVVSFRTWFCQRLRSKAGLRIKTWKRQRGDVTPLPDQPEPHQRTRPRRKPADYLLSRPRRRPMDRTRGPEDTMADDTLAALAEQAKVPVIVGETVAAFLARGGRIRRVPARPAVNFPADFAAARAQQLWLGRRQSHTHTPRTARKEQGDHPAYRALEARLDVHHLAACLTAKEQGILALYVDFKCVVSKEFAEALGYEQHQARNKISYIKKKMKQHIKRAKEFFPHNHDFGE